MQTIHIKYWAFFFLRIITEKKNVQILHILKKYQNLYKGWYWKQTVHIFSW